MTTTIPLSALIAASAALNAIVESVGAAVPYELWRKCLDARSELGWRVDMLVAAIAPVEVTATPADFEALQAKAVAS